MHPASALLICLTSIVAIQFFGPSGLALVLLALVVDGRRVLPGWWALSRRMANNSGGMLRNVYFLPYGD